MFPLIPILAIAAIIGGIATLSWYSKLSKEERIQADSLAMKWFGKQFQQLGEKQRQEIKNLMNPKG
jgi:hypothetical protein